MRNTWTGISLAYTLVAVSLLPGFIYAFTWNMWPVVIHRLAMVFIATEILLFFTTAMVTLFSRSRGWQIAASVVYMVLVLGSTYIAQDMYATQIKIWLGFN